MNLKPKDNKSIVPPKSSNLKNKSEVPEESGYKKDKEKRNQQDPPEETPEEMLDR